MRYEFYEEKKHWKGSWKLTLAAGLIFVAGALGPHIVCFNEFEKKLNPKKGLEKKVVQESNMPSQNIKLINDKVDYGKIEKKYSKKEALLLGQVIYGEAANQPEIAREASAKVSLNRVGKPGYDSSLIKILTKKNAISSMNGKGSKNWKQATGKLKMNAYEKIIFKRCLQDAKDVLNGKRLGYKNEDKWTAYFDKSVSYEDLLKKNPRYWKTVIPDVNIGAFTFCVPRD